MGSALNKSWQATLDAIPHVIWTALPDGTYSYLNRRWYEFTGQLRDLPEPDSFTDAVHPEDRAVASSSWASAVATGRDFEVRVRLRAAGGGFRWVRLRAARELAENHPSRWLGTCTDIHELVLAEIALEHTEARLQNALDHFPHMIWTATADGSHDYFSRSWYDFTGAQKGSVDGQRWSTLFHPEDQKRMWPRWRHSLETGEPFEIEYRLLHHSGDYRWMLCQALAERDEAGRVFRWRGTCTDIHEQVVAEETLPSSSLQPWPRDRRSS